MSKSNYYHNFFNDNANNIKNTWKGIKQIININNKSNNHPSSLFIDNKLITDPKGIANEFNVYFSTIAERLQGRIYHNGQDFSSYLTNRNEHNFFMKHTDSKEILELINNLNSNKASGPYSIPSEILHLIKFIIADPLSKIINHSFENGVYFDKGRHPYCTLPRKTSK